MWVELRRHWPVLLAAVLGIGASCLAFPFYIIGPLSPSLAAEFGWSRTAIMAAASFHLAGLALATPWIGRFLGRTPPNLIAAGSAASGALAMASLSLLPPHIAILYGTHLVMGALAGCAAVVVTRVVGAHFEKARGFALGVTLAGAGLASFLTPFLVASAVDGGQWRHAYVFVALVMAVSVPTSLVLLKLPPRDASLAGLPVAAIPHPRARYGSAPFIVLTLIFGIVWLISPGLGMLFVPMLIDQGLSHGEAAEIASLLGLSAIAGRIGIGWIVDHTRSFLVGFLLFAVVAGGCTASLWGGPTASVLLVITIGLMTGAEIDLMSYLAMEYFGVENYPRMYGMLFGVSSGAGIASPVLVGAVLERAGYEGVFLLAAGAFVVTSVLFLLLGWTRPMSRSGRRPATGLSPSGARFAEDRDAA